MLSAAEEHALATRLTEHNDLTAAKKLILTHLKFVVKVAKGYSGYGLAMADLIQEGNVGLMKAVKRFNPSRGVRLASFAIHWIKAEIHEFVLRNWRIVKIATTKAQRKLFFNLRSIKQRCGWLGQTETKQIAATVTEMENRLTHDISLDNDEDQDNLDVITVNKALADHSQNPAQLLEASNWDSDVSERFHEAFAKLSQRSKDILTKRWLNEPKATLQELADQYQVSAERIRQLEKVALDKLKLNMTN
jgi:RNA polymerase sigma-32 factor